MSSSASGASPEKRKDGVRNAEPQQVAGLRRGLHPDERQRAAVVSLGLLGVEGVVVGDEDEAQAHGLGGRRDLRRRPGPVGGRGVDVDDSGHAREAVGRFGPAELQRAP
jgi:hypothetical protein